MLIIPKFASSLPMPNPINATPVPRPAISSPPLIIPVSAIRDFTAPTINEAVMLIPIAIANAL